MELYTGVVENRQDPLKLGRCQVRVVGLHTHDKAEIPTSDLPWAYPMQSVTSAAMSGIGQSPVGPVEGTWVVIMFRDDDNQMPIMLGTVGGISQKFGPVDQDPEGIILKDETGTSETPTVAESVVTTNAGTSQSLTPQQQAQNVIAPGTNPTTITTDIPTIPPKGTPNTTAATAGIKAILAACEKFGLTTREQKCSLLAIAGGESLWVPKEEGYNYSADALQSTFKSTFGGKPELASQYARWKGSREEFFNFVYAPENNGRQLGNTQAGDGGKYYGRGFNGVTGRSNYSKFGSLAGLDLINNPTILSTNLSAAAEVFCLMVINNPVVKKANPSANPGYFEAVKKGNGNDTGNGAQVRRDYYEYFYGTKVLSSFTEEKSPDAVATPDEPAQSQPAPASNNAGPMGFRDPNNKYPLKKFFNEPDTNRLARGIKIGTIHPVKDTNRAQSIPIALSETTFDEPLSSYSAKYPYNHVLETESGHVQELDDTPGHERTLSYHRKGTFTEVDPNGTEIHHIIGDSYTIIDRNGCIYVEGEVNLTVKGNVNILSKSNVNLEVNGDLTAQVGGNYTLGVAGNYQVAVGGTYSVQSKGNMNHQTEADKNDVSIQNMNSYSNGDINLKASGNLAGDATRIDWNGGVASGAESLNLTYPEAALVEGKNLPYLVSPASEGESLFLIETEDEWASPAGQAKVAELEKEYGPTPTTVSEEAPASGGSNVAVAASCQIIQGTENFANDFRLSPNFTLGMLIDGGVNGKNQLRDQNGLTKQQIVCNLAQLCLNIYEPMLAILPGGIGGYGKQWKINSGYRISSNVPAGGVTTSDHMLGRATDFTLLPYDSTKAERNFNFASQIEKILPYDQIIMEYMAGGSNWIHVGYRGTKNGDTSGGGVNRKMAFTMSNGKTIKRDGFALL